MPLVDDEPSFAPAAFGRPEQAPKPADVGFMDALGPAFRTDNIVGSTLANMPSMGADDSPRVNPWPQIEGTEYEPLFESFVDLETQAQVDRMKARIDREREDRRVLQEAGIQGFMASMVASVVDVPSLLPFGGAAAGIRGGVTAGRVAARTAGLAAAEAAGTELVFQSQQQMRTALESGTAIGGSAVLGAMLGGAAGAALARSEAGRQAFQAAAKGIDEQVKAATIGGVSQQVAAQAAGAAPVRAPELTDFALPTRAASAVQRVTPGGLSFTDRFAKARSPVARRVGTELIANEYAYAGTDELGLSPSAERMTDIAFDRYASRVARSFRDGARAAAKEGITAHDFGQRVAMAMRRGDVDPQSAAVTQAAQKLRDQVVEPLKNQAIALKLLPENVRTTTAATYFTRMWDGNRIVARSNEFIERLTKHFVRGSDYHTKLAEDQARQKLSAAMTDLQDLTDPARAPMDDEVFRFLQERKELRSRRAELRRLRAEYSGTELVRYVQDVLGGIDPNGDLGQYLKTINITPRTRPGLFKKGGRKRLDNLDSFPSEFETQMPRNGNYLDEQAVVDRLVDEILGQAEMPARIADIDAEMRALDELIEAGEAEAKAQGRTTELSRIRELAKKIEGLERQVTDASRKREMTPDELQFYAREMAKEVYDTLTNAKSPTETLLIKVTPRGPLKERTLSVKDVDFEDFLINDAEFVLQRYARIMAGENELTQKFGSVDLDTQIAEIRADYERLREAATTEKERLRLDAEMKRVIKATEASRDMIRGTYQAKEKATAPYRAMQTAMTYNFVRALGNVVVSSLPDVFKVTMANGMLPVVRDALVPLMTNTRAYRAAAKQSGDVAGIAEILLNSRLMRLADVTDPYANATPIEQVAHWMGSKASLFSGMLHWNQFLKEMVTNLAQTRMARLADVPLDKLPKRERRFLQRHQINANDWARIQQEMQAHGEWTNGIYDPGLDKWQPQTRRLWSAVLRGEADTAIVTPGIGDKVPFVEEHWFLKPALQFKSFALASHRKTMLLGLQEDQARFLSNAALMVSMGMFVYWLKSLSWRDGASDDPGKWLAEGIDRSGIIPLVMEANNMYESIGAPGIYAALQGEWSPEAASRYQVRSSGGALLGPTFGLINDTAQTISMPFQEDVTPGDITAARRLVPFGRHPGVKEFLDLWVVPELQEAVD